jgi:hypothetical protein
MIESMKSSVRVLEYAAQILEEKSLEGKNNLVKLGFPIILLSGRTHL